jgi:L-asparaginase
MGAACSVGKPIHLLFTGGTISMQHDAVRGGNVPVHGGGALVDLAPDLGRVAPFTIDDWARLPACHLGRAELWAMRERVRTVAESGEVAGIVITHGTDILEETAYLLARTLEPDVPVVLTGAMRTAGHPEWDGTRNLTDAARVANAEASKGRGAMVVFAGGIFAGAEAVKVDTMGLAAFGTPHGEPLGRVENGLVRYADAARSCRRPPLRPAALDARVALVQAVPGDDGVLLDLARPAHAGLVLVAFGSGNAPPGIVPAVRRWLDDGKPVVLASRCASGQVTPGYAFDGGGAQLAALGAVPAGARNASQAWMELTIALSAGVAYDA